MGDSEEDLSNPDAISSGGKLMLWVIILLLLAVALFVVLKLCAKFFCGRPPAVYRTQSRRWIVFGGDRDSALAPRRGLDPSVVRSLPVLVFRRADFKDGLECAVCLCELSDGETARLLPKCNHGFHLGCIDMWFQSHSTCPLCRSLIPPDSRKEEIRVPELNPAADGHPPEWHNFPTNILIWGTQDRVSAGGSVPVKERHGSSSSSFPSPKLEGNEMVVIDVPLQYPKAYSIPSSSTPTPEEMKSPTAATRLRSLKRLLSRDRRAAPSTATIANVEMGGNCLISAKDSAPSES